MQLLQSQLWFFDSISLFKFKFFIFNGNFCFASLSFSFSSSCFTNSILCWRFWVSELLYKYFCTPASFSDISYKIFVKFSFYVGLSKRPSFLTGRCGVDFLLISSGKEKSELISASFSSSIFRSLLEVLFHDGVVLKWDFAPTSKMPLIPLTASSINRRSDICCSKGVSEQYLLGQMLRHELNHFFILFFICVYGFFFWVSLNYFEEHKYLFLLCLFIIYFFIYIFIIYIYINNIKFIINIYSFLYTFYLF